MKVYRILIIIPCYNEEQNIDELLHQLYQLNLPNIEFKILPINDHSTDGTLENIKKYSTSYLNLPNNLGIGGAVQAGIKFAFLNDFDFAIQVDGDGQHPVSELPKLTQSAIENECDICIGSRYITKQGYQSSKIRRFGIRYLNKLIQVTSGQIVFDCTSGFRSFNRRAIKLFNTYYPDKYPEPEAIVYGKLNGLRIMEVPVIMAERKNGSSSILGISVLIYIIKVSLNILYLKLNFVFKKLKIM